MILIQDLHEIWTSVSHKSAMKRNCIQELDELFVKYESERAAVVAYQNRLVIIIMYNKILRIYSIYCINCLCFTDYCNPKQIHKKA